MDESATQHLVRLNATLSKATRRVGDPQKDKCHPISSNLTRVRKPD